jgi:membrane-associated protein
MATLPPWLLAGLMAYGMPVLFVTIFVGSLGIPFPITLLVMAAGAFARTDVFDPGALIAACLAGAVAADHCEYLLGRSANGWLHRRFRDKLAWQKAHSALDRQGGWAIVLTRVWLTPLAPAINVLAGGRFPYLRFLFFDLIGELIWVLLFGSLGYFFAAQYPRIHRVVEEFSMASFVAVAIGVILYLAVRYRRKRDGSIG